jgi:hypothetical protein
LLLSRLGAFPELAPGLERVDDSLLWRQIWPRLVPLLSFDDRVGLERWSHDLARRLGALEPWEPELR